MKKKSGKINIHIIFFVVVGIIFLFAVIRFLIWNKGEDSGYDPNEINTEFEVETMDHIQPMELSRLEHVADDGVTSILFLGNSSL